MSKLISIIECSRCGRELMRREEGEYKNPNGSMTCNTQIYRCNPSLCSYCNPGERKNVNSSMEVANERSQNLWHSA